MINSIFIPTKLKVGFNKRNDTYSKKLAYVIYFDAKGKLRKETSWENWREKDIEPEEYDNALTEGFVLNKKVGGDSSSWDHRQTYTRVFDPRGFEFEITVPNLLYILENTSCIKGKGLEGKFVYGWDGPDLVLLPEAAPEFVKLTEFSDTLKNRIGISSKTMILGGTYLTDKNIELVYLGRFKAYSPSRAGVVKDLGKKYYFTDLKTDNKDDKYHVVTGLTKIIKVISTDCVENYAELIQDLECTTTYSPIDPERDVYIPLTEDRVLDKSTGLDYYDRYKYYFNYKDYKCRLYLSGYNDGRYAITAYNDTKYVPVKDNYNYSYWNHKDGVETELNGIIKQYEDPKVVTTNHAYRHTKESVLALNEKFNLTYRKRFLQNGKEYKP